MDEYITRNNAISAVCLGCNQQFSDEPCEPSDCTIRRSIMALPAADVAPRAEVAREIIGEILSTNTPDVDGFFTIHESELAALKKKYTEGQK